MEKNEGHRVDQERGQEEKSVGQILCGRAIGEVKVAQLGEKAERVLRR